MLNAINERTGKIKGDGEYKEEGDSYVCPECLLPVNASRSTETGEILYFSHPRYTKRSGWNCSLLAKESTSTTNKTSMAKQLEEWVEDGVITVARATMMFETQSIKAAKLKEEIAILKSKIQTLESREPQIQVEYRDKPVPPIKPADIDEYADFPELTPDVKKLKEAGKSVIFLQHVYCKDQTPVYVIAEVMKALAQPNLCKRNKIIVTQVQQVIGLSNQDLKNCKGKHEEAKSVRRGFAEKFIRYKVYNESGNI